MKLNSISIQALEGGNRAKGTAFCGNLNFLEKSWYKFCYCYIVLTSSFNINFMKKLFITSILLTFLFAGTALMAQENQDDYLGLPGDNLNLYAVMRLFQQSKTLEEFEKNLNDPNTNINNLDLNGDDLVDYIKVFDDVDGDVHNIVLQVAVSPRENQDVAVFTVQRLRDGEVQIQLTGDEELYGKNYIIEPIYGDVNPGETANPGYSGSTRTVNGQSVTIVRTTPVQIATWPLVRFIFLPGYTVWHSNWYWGYYPSYWHPWHSYSWNYYYGFHSNWYNDYYGQYHRWDYHRYSRWNDYYYAGRRTYSNDVRHRIEQGNYKTTYSHPEDRRAGEARFVEMHPDQVRRSSPYSSGNNSNVVRRSNNSVSRRTGTSPSNNNNGISRRPYTNGMNRSESNHSSNNGTVTNRKSENVITDRPVVKSGSQRNTFRRSESSATNKPMNNPSSDQNTRVNRSSNQTKTVGNSQSRRSLRNSKSETPVKKDDKMKDPDNKDSGHRR